MMIRSGIALFQICAICGFLFFAVPADAARKTYGDAVVQVVRVIDGDTFRANIEGWPPIIGENIRVRIAGVDTPEPEERSRCPREKALARKAGDFARKLLKAARKVELKNIRRGNHFRILADVYADGVNVAEALIRAGLGRPYRGGKKRSWCS